MIKFIYGDSPNARRNEIIEMIRRDTAARKRTFLLVPEQFAVETERALLRALPASAQLTLEILNFSRLYNRVCREYGGIRYNYITKPVRYSMMWKNLRELSPHLETYGNTAKKDSSFCEIALSAIGELKGSCRTAADLENAARKLHTDDPLAKKLRDLALIYSSFDNLVSQTFSDSSDDISRLSDILSEHSFFAGANVYIDAFTSFTAAEHKVIAQIFESADSTAVSIPLAYPHEDTLFTASTLDSERRLFKSAEGLEQTTLVAEGDSSQNKNVKYLADTIFSAREESIASDSGVYCTVCTSPYTEAEAAARIALGLLREGYRCRDIVVIARNAENYRGIIEPAFDKCALPYYFSEKTDLSATPLVKFLLSALRIKLYNFRTSDVIVHLSVGLYDFPERDLDIFEQYVSSWQIKGDTFTKGEFTMNPDGYYAPASMSERARAALATANAVREALVDNLTTLFDELDRGETVAEKCRALYAFLVRSGVEKRLRELSEREAKRENTREAQEYARLFARVCDGLAELASAMSQELSDDGVTTEEFNELLTLFFSKSDLGTIPTAADQIIIGSASTLRTDSPKCAVILGLCEGVFPATVSEKGLFSLSEREALADVGIELSSGERFASSDELMYLKRALSTPSERLYLFTHSSTSGGAKATPSLPFIRAKKLFKEDASVYDSRDILKHTPTLGASLPYLKDLEGTPHSEALLECALESEEFSPLLKNASIPVSDTECSVSEDRARSIFGERMALSQSKLDKFIKCRFNYYCQYVLKLREEKVSRFEANDIGSFIHYILEKLLCRIVTKNGVDPELDKKQIETLADELVRSYIKTVTEGITVSARLSHLYRKLYNVTLVLLINIVEEFKHSSFRPEFFELETNGKGDNPSARKFILKDGTEVVFSGIIDRVDIYRCEDGRVYIRVVDYKTGTKRFSLDDIQYGLNIQMLLYLFTLTNNENDNFKNRLGGEPKPAGVVYLSSNIPVVDLLEGDTDKDVLSKAQKELTRSGLLLDSDEVLTAMNEDKSPGFLVSGTGNKNTRANVLSSEEFFEELQQRIDSIVTEIATEMRSGRADASPLVHGDSDPCSWCKMKPICRYKNEKGDFD